MEMHKMHVVIPEDHRLVVDVPERIRSGPAQLIFVSPESTQGTAKAADQRALARWDSIMAELEADDRDFRELSAEERRQRLSRIRGMGKGILPTSEQVALEKRQEIELEEAKFGR
jgi:hypothetical protein